MVPKPFPNAAFAAHAQLFKRTAAAVVHHCRAASSLAALDLTLSITLLYKLWKARTEY
jgi:hypothetical protein